MKTSRNAPPPVLSTQSGMRVVVLGISPAQILDVTGPLEVFSEANALLSSTHRSETSATDRAPFYKVELLAVPQKSSNSAQRKLMTSCGVALHGDRTLTEALADPIPIGIFLIAGGAGARHRCGEPELCAAIRQLAARAQRTVSVCTGAFPLAAAGLLKGRKAVTHWRWCARLARDFPSVRVDPEPIYIREGTTWTSAGVTAGMDLALALVEEDLGHALALEVARELVMFLRRPGGQSQFSATLEAQTHESDDRWKDLHGWMVDHLDASLTVESLAARVHLSPRQFARVFVKHFGVSPAKRVEQLRVEAARRRLENSPRETVANVAARCGFGSEETMRCAFLRVLRVPPAHYRARFSSPSRRSLPPKVRKPKSR